MPDLRCALLDHWIYIEDRAHEGEMLVSDGADSPFVREFLQSVQREKDVNVHGKTAAIPIVAYDGQSQLSGASRRRDQTVGGISVRIAEIKRLVTFPN